MHRLAFLPALRWPAILLLAAGVAALAVWLGGDVRNASVLECRDPYCARTYVEYHSYGWPVPWRTDAPPEAVDELLGSSSLRQFGLGINDGGVSLWALGANAVLWFFIALAALVLIDALVFRRWRSARTFTRAVLPVCLVLGLASLLTVMGTLRTTGGTWNGIVAYESAGLPFEWKTSPWLRAEPDGAKPVEEMRAALRPSNMLGFSPLYASLSFFAWLFVSGAAVLVALRLAPLVPKAWGLRELASPSLTRAAPRRPEGPE